jgi:hypothetical protein
MPSKNNDLVTCARGIVDEDTVYAPHQPATLA